MVYDIKDTLENHTIDPIEKKFKEVVERLNKGTLKEIKLKGITLENLLKI